jgi:hypothetical protein
MRAAMEVMLWNAFPSVMSRPATSSLMCRRFAAATNCSDPPVRKMHGGQHAAAELGGPPLTYARATCPPHLAAKAREASVIRSSPPPE